MSRFVAVGDQSVLGDLKELSEAFSSSVPLAVADSKDTTPFFDPANGIVKIFVHHVTPIRVSDGGKFVVKLLGFGSQVDDETGWRNPEVLDGKVYVDLDINPSSGELNNNGDISAEESFWEGGGFNTSDSGVHHYCAYRTSEGFLAFRLQFYSGTDRWLSFIQVAGFNGKSYSRDDFKSFFSTQIAL